MSGHILALDTATEACSVALLSAGRTIERFEIARQKHAQRILPLIDDVLNEAEISLQQLSVLAFGCGPGSFTGVRIATSIAQGLAFGAGLPVVGVSTLATLAQGSHRVFGAKQILVAIDARMGELYWAEYNYDSKQGLLAPNGEQVIHPSQAVVRMQNLTGEWAIAGTGWQAYPELYSASPLVLPSQAEVLFPAAVDLLPFAIQAFNEGRTVTAEQVTATYLRDNIVKKSLANR